MVHATNLSRDAAFPSRRASATDSAEVEIVVHITGRLSGKLIWQQQSPRRQLISCHRRAARIRCCNPTSLDRHYCRLTTGQSLSEHFAKWSAFSVYRRSRMPQFRIGAVCETLLA